MALSLCFFLLLSCSLAAAQQLDWWQTTVFYQIYPRSFKDSNGDGVGDLNGISSNLDHLKDLGVGATWLSPIFKSPMVDFGYDIADFKDVDPIFGSLQDFDALNKKAKELGIKLILDFVPNHSSDENEWFVKSVKRIEPYTDYYMWVDAKVDPQTGKESPPNNWVSAFRGSAWEWNDERGQYYLHQFAVKQPDLNYRNPAVVEEMKNVLRFWLDRGVAGFRVDAVPWMFEVEDLRDEPLSGDPNAQPGDAGYLIHVYTQNLNETYEMVQQWREVMEEYKEGDTRLMMLETYGSTEQVMRYYGTTERPGAHFPFNFRLIINLNKDSSAQDFANQIHEWLDNVPEGRWSNWVIGNHDQHRVASRYSSALADGLTMISQMLPGSGVTYNGEEIAMEDNTDITWEETKDPQACNSDPGRYQSFTRDPERTPFQWDDTVSAGFSTNPTTWLPMNKNYKQLNLKKQKEAEISHYKVYKRILEARKTQTIIRGSLKVQVLNQNVLSFSRELQGSETFIVAVNLGEEQDKVNLMEAYQGLPADLHVYTASVDSGNRRGEQLEANSITLKPKAALLLTTQQVPADA